MGQLDRPHMASYARSGRSKAVGCARRRRGRLWRAYLTFRVRIAFPYSCAPRPYSTTCWWRLQKHQALVGVRTLSSRVTVLGAGAFPDREGTSATRRVDLALCGANCNRRAPLSYPYSSCVTRLTRAFSCSNYDELKYSMRAALKSWGKYARRFHLIAA